MLRFQRGRNIYVLWIFSPNESLSQKSISVMWITKRVTMHPLSFYNRTSIFSPVVTKAACVRTYTSSDKYEKRVVNQSKEIGQARLMVPRGCILCIASATLGSEEESEECRSNIARAISVWDLSSRSHWARSHTGKMQNRLSLSPRAARAWNIFTPAARLHRTTRSCKLTSTHSEPTKETSCVAEVRKI